MCGADPSGASTGRIRIGSSPRVRSRRRRHGFVFRRVGIISACAEQTRKPGCSPRTCWDHLRVCGADAEAEPLPARREGSSPRVRSRHVHVRVGFGWRGIISACAEQTIWSASSSRSNWDHLRVCGADYYSYPWNCILRGIISACAEQTGMQGYMDVREWDHLRVCGADVGGCVRVFPDPGSSPRVRSRPRMAAPVRQPPGIISACAEQTRCFRKRVCQTPDHLRVCGADKNPVSESRRKWGSSPRVRSRPLLHERGVRRVGIISACAEQTARCGVCEPWRGDHLRVCGADMHTVEVPTLNSWIISACAEQTVFVIEDDGLHWDHLRVCGADLCRPRNMNRLPGSSPRVRSRPVTQSAGKYGSGIISACAEQTTRTRNTWARTTDHLRVCGADARRFDIDAIARGSSPRVRSRHDGWKCAYANTGIISACAEQTACRAQRAWRARDHLRVCGADAAAVAVVMFVAGSSPRVRSRLNPHIQLRP